MTQDQEARIRQRAYEIWQDEGTPSGRAEANWLRAESELSREAVDPVWQGEDSASMTATPEEPAAAAGRRRRG
ncbi:DUF2934 domain-containing protein [Tabrizicola sp.]|uniref:DUF2934 domain-containing protein n=1 Tax=Tabrizicola sp. TaxID=2005166 RepID=UPI0035B2E123